MEIAVEKGTAKASSRAGSEGQPETEAAEADADVQALDRGNLRAHVFPGVTRMLRKLREEGFLLAAVSRTVEPDWARELLRVLRIDQYFHYKEIYPGSKTAHFKALRAALKKDNLDVPFQNMLFFDDENRNIRDCEKLGITCIFVENGMNLELLLRGLHLFSLNRVAREEKQNNDNN